MNLAVNFCITSKDPELTQNQKCNYLSTISKTLTGKSALLSHLEDNVNFISTLNDCDINLSVFPRIGSKDYFQAKVKLNVGLGILESDRDLEIIAKMKQSLTKAMSEGKFSQSIDLVNYTV